MGSEIRVLRERERDATALKMVCDTQGKKAIVLCSAVFLPHCATEWSHVQHLCEDQLTCNQLEQEIRLPLSVQARGGLVRLFS